MPSQAVDAHWRSALVRAAVQNVHPVIGALDMAEIGPIRLAEVSLVLVQAAAGENAGSAAGLLLTASLAGEFQEKFVECAAARDRCAQ